MVLGSQIQTENSNAHYSKTNTFKRFIIQKLKKVINLLRLDL